jgi:hypothetical protein
VGVERCISQALFGNGRLNFVVEIPPAAGWHVCCKYDLVEGDLRRRALVECAHALATSEPAQTLAQWKRITTQITTSNEDVYRVYRQSVEDMAALRLTRDDDHPQELLAAAGVPWFVTVFGRDSLIVSLQNMMVYPDFARGTLQRLADLQAVAAGRGLRGLSKKLRSPRDYPAPSPARTRDLTRGGGASACGSSG